MPWTFIEDTPNQLLRWQARLTQESPDSGPLTMIMENAVVQTEGTFGEASVSLLGSNSGEAYVPFDSHQYADIVAVLPMTPLYLKAFAFDADATTDVLVTLVGRR